jgi:hypothetical protein
MNYENIIYQSLWDSVKTTLTGKLMALNAYEKRRELAM